MRYTRRTLVKIAPAATLAALGVAGLGGSALAAGPVFRAPLSGAEQVPPVATDASGHAIFEVNPGGTSLTYWLIVNGLTNVTAAHIHLGARGTNGPVVAFLYGGPTIPGRFVGLLAHGTITAANLVGPLKGHPLSDLLAAMAAGNTYVNVHTTAEPGGAIRGQIA
jgi:hypothetical protein